MPLCRRFGSAKPGVVARLKKALVEIMIVQISTSICTHRWAHAQKRHECCIISLFIAVSMVREYNIGHRYRHPAKVGFNIYLGPKAVYGFSHMFIKYESTITRG